MEDGKAESEHAEKRRCGSLNAEGRNLGGAASTSPDGGRAVIRVVVGGACDFVANPSALCRDAATRGWARFVPALSQVEAARIKAEIAGGKFSKKTLHCFSTVDASDGFDCFSP